MKRGMVRVLICIFLSLTLVGCSSKYNTEDFIGKSSAEIVSQYGAFDCTTMPVNEDGLYKNCRCGYTIREEQKGFFGKSAEILFFVVFDENGMAIQCEEGNRPGN